MFTSCRIEKPTRASARSCWIDGSYTLRHLCFITALVIAFAGGCSRAPHSENVKLGEADYPVVNSSPADIVNLTVIIPETVKARLSQVYITRVTGGSIDSGPPCAFIQTYSQSRDQYYIEPPLELSKTKKDVFSGRVVVDRYLPGNCAWALAGVWYGIAAGMPDRAELLRVSGSVPPVANGRIDIWCIHGQKRDPKFSEVCTSARLLQLQFPDQISEATMGTIVSSGGANGPPVLLTLKLGSLVIQFHDLDAVDKDLALRTD